MTYEELIRETGEKIGLEGFAPDDDGVCILASEIGEIAIMDCKGVRDMVLLNAVVTDVPPDAGAALMEALKANRGFWDTRGATLSIDPETRRFELTQYAELEALTPDWLVKIIESFAETLVETRETLEGAVSSGGSLEEAFEDLGFMEIIMG